MPYAALRAMMNQMLFSAAVTFLILALGLATWQSGRLLRKITPQQNLLLSIPDNLTRFVLLVLCVALGTWTGPGIDLLGWRADRLLRESALGVIVGLCLAPLLMWAGYAAIKRWGPEIYDNRLLRAIVPIDRKEWIGVVLALLPAAALEELLFRSMPLAGFAWLGSPWLLMWPLSLIFGLMHGTQGQWGVVGTALMGLMLSALFLWTGSIWAPLFAHWVLNVVEVTLAQQQGLRPLRADFKRDSAPLS